MGTEAVLAYLDSLQHPLIEREAADRLARYGPS
jgi:hypothetical protein